MTNHLLRGTMPYFLGIDLGTSSVKCALVDADTLQIVVTATHEVALSYPDVGYVEQSPTEWWQATQQAIHDLGKEYTLSDVIGIGFSGQMHGTVLLDDSGEVLHPAIIWADQRSSTMLDDLLAIPNYVAITGTYPATGFMGATLRWLALNKPDVLARTSTVLLPKDYLRYRLTGEYHTDVSDAASTGLFNIRQQDWAWDVIEQVSIPSAIFPPVVTSYTPIGTLLPEVADQLGLSVTTTVVAGCADQPAQAIGNGILSADRMSITLGSGGQVFVPLASIEGLQADKRIHMFNHAVTGWYALGAILSAGLSLRWLRDLLDLSDHDNAYDLLEASARECPIGADGLLFIPYLNGERTPHMNPSATGAFIGLTSRHTQSHLIRAVMEGVAFAIRQAYEACIANANTAPTLVIGAGGGMGSNLWRQIIVDVLNISIHSTAQTEQAALGAGSLAGIGLRYYGDSLEENIDFITSQLTQLDRVTHPQADRDAYDKQYQIFKDIYPLLNK